MAEIIRRTTRLDAVNAILRNIGEQQVTTLIDSSRADLVHAVAELDQQSREVQGEGWRFNISNITLTPQELDSRIAIPSDAMSLLWVDHNMRGDYLYNRTTNSLTFTDPVDAQLILQLPFEDLPEHARYYILMRASRVVAQNRIGDPQTVQFTAGDEAYARYQLEAHELETSDFNALAAPGVRNINNPILR